MTGKNKGPKGLSQQKGDSKPLTMKPTQKLPQNRGKAMAKETGASNGRAERGSHTMDQVHQSLQRLSLSDHSPNDPMFSRIGTAAMGHAARVASPIVQMRKMSDNNFCLPSFKDIAKRVHREVGMGKKEKEYENALVVELMRLNFEVTQQQRQTNKSLPKKYQYSDQSIMGRYYYTGSNKTHKKPTIPNDAIDEEPIISDLIVRWPCGRGPWHILELKAVHRLGMDDFDQVLRYMQTTGHPSAYLMNFGNVLSEVYEKRAGQRYFSPMFDNDGPKTVSVREKAVVKYLNGTCENRTIHGNKRKWSKLPCGLLLPPADLLQKVDYKNAMLEPKQIKNKQSTKPSKTKRQTGALPSGNSTPEKSSGKAPTSKRMAKVTGTPKKSTGTLTKASPRKTSTTPGQHVKQHNATPKKMAFASTPSPRHAKKVSASPIKPKKNQSGLIGETRRLKI